MTRQGDELGVYLAPDDILDDEDLLPRLADAGVSEVVLRSGFDPSRPDEGVEPAADRVRDVGLSLCLLVGGWWGEGIEPGADAMRCFADGLPPVTADTAHESRWPMHCPLGRWTQVVAEAAASLTRACSPRSVCLTHARFHHAADLPGLFTHGGLRFITRMRDAGLSIERLRSSLQRLEHRLRRLDPKSLVRASSGPGFDCWLDGLVGDDLFSRWFAFRRQVMVESIAEVGRRLRSSTAGAIRFGVNLLNPLLAPLSGPAPVELRGVVDFVQPLLGYVRWHVAEPIERLASWLRSMQPAMTRDRAVETVAVAIGVEDASSLRECLQPDAGEGRGESLARLLAHHRARLRAGTVEQPSVQVVLRGAGWDPAWLRGEIDRWRDAGFRRLVFQGTEALMRGMP